MGCCAICGKPDSKAFLFWPSDVFVFLCDKHTVKRIKDNSNKPIAEWCEEEKQKAEDLKNIVKMLDDIHTENEKRSM